MEKIVNVMKKNALSMIFGLFVLFFYGDIHAMIARGQKEFAAMQQRAADRVTKQLQSQVIKLQPDEFFVSSVGTSKGIIVPKKVLIRSAVMKNMIEDIQRTDKVVPVPFSYETIKKAFEILDDVNEDRTLLDRQMLSAHVNKLSLPELISLLNIFDYLDVPKNFINRIMEEVVVRIEKDIIPQYKTLMSDMNELDEVAFSERLSQYDSLKKLSPFIDKKIRELIGQESPIITWVNDLRGRAYRTWPSTYAVKTILDRSDSIAAFFETYVAEAFNRLFQLSKSE